VRKKNYIREIFHYCNEGCTNWFGFSKKIFEYSNKEVKVIPISTEEFGSKVKRPTYSVLDTTKIKDRYNIEIPHWEESLKRCLEEINKN
jgi:dTDP-4-dehydrorhamnose reductase